MPSRRTRKAETVGEGSSRMRLSCRKRHSPAAKDAQACPPLARTTTGVAMSSFIHLLFLATGRPATPRRREKEITKIKKRHMPLVQFVCPEPALSPVLHRLRHPCPCCSLRNAKKQSRRRCSLFRSIPTSPLFVPKRHAPRHAKTRRMKDPKKKKKQTLRTNK